MNIFIWGTGENTEKFLNVAQLTSKSLIVGLIDGNNSCADSVKFGFPVISVNKINKYDYDYIIVCSIYTNEILYTAKREKINEKKLLFIKGHPENTLISGTYEYLRLKRIVRNCNKIYTDKAININFIRIKVLGFIGNIIRFYLGFNINNYYICCPYGIGDTIIIAGLCEEFKKVIKKKIILIVKNNHQSIPNYYKNGVDGKIVNSTIVEMLRLYSENRGIMRRKNYLYGHFLPDYQMPLNKHVVDCFLENVLKLNPKLEMKRPQLKNAEGQNLKKEKVAILMPYACSVEEYPIKLWENISKVLVQIGYVVYTNTKDEKEKEIKGTKRLNLNLNDTIAFCKNDVEVIVSIRSGICDLLCYTNINLIVLYNSIQLQKWYSLKRLNSTADIKEIITENKSEQAISDIVENVLKKYF